MELLPRALQGEPQSSDLSLGPGLPHQGAQQIVGQQMYPNTFSPTMRAKRAISLAPSAMNRLC